MTEGLFVNHKGSTLANNFRQWTEIESFFADTFNRGSNSEFLNICQLKCLVGYHFHFIA